MEIKRIAIDTSKHVFTLHGVDEREHPVLRRELKRHQVEGFFAKLPPTEVVVEACGGSHHWGRKLTALGQRLIPPQYVKPFVKRSKNDQKDAEAISEAAARPSMRFVPIKSAEAQADAMLLSVRELLVKQRTQLVNALRGHAAEFGVVMAKGVGRAAALVERLEADPAIPAPAREMFVFLGRQITELDQRLAELERKLVALHKAMPMSLLLAEAPGIGPIGAMSFVLKVDPHAFRSGRHFAAWVGLTPKESSTGGKQRLGRISREGNERLRQLLVLGATSIIKAVAKPGNKHASPWLLGLLRRRPRKVAAVALANKMARIVWAMMMSGEAYRPMPANA
jgi:transposase